MVLGPSPPPCFSPPPLPSRTPLKCGSPTANRKPSRSNYFPPATPCARPRAAPPARGAEPLRTDPRTYAAGGSRGPAIDDKRVQPNTRRVPVMFTPTLLAAREARRLADKVCGKQVSNRSGGAYRADAKESAMRAAIDRFFLSVAAVACHHPNP